MSEPDDRPTPDSLDEATRALRDTAPPAGPPAELTAATVAAIQHRFAGTAPAGELARKLRRRKIMRIIGFGTATAAAVALAAGVVWFGGSAAAHMQKAIENAEKATSVKVTMTVENKGKVTEVRTFHRQGDMVRMEVVVGATPPDAPVAVVDLKTRKVLTLLAGAKSAERSEIGGQEVKFISGMMGDFAGLKAQLGGGEKKAVKVLGEEKISDRNTTAYEITSAEPVAGVWKVWVDPKTEFPVRLRLPGEAKQSFTLDFEDWNKKFDAKLFSQDVPDGYKLKEPKE